MENNVVLDIIIEFVKAVKGAKKEIVSVVNGKEYKIKAAGYLLGQIIRQYNEYSAKDEHPDRFELNSAAAQIEQSNRRN